MGYAPEGSPPDANHAVRRRRTISGSSEGIDGALLKFLLVHVNIGCSEGAVSINNFDSITKREVDA